MKFDFIEFPAAEKAVFIYLIQTDFESFPALNHTRRSASATTIGRRRSRSRSRRSVSVGRTRQSLLLPTSSSSSPSCPPLDPDVSAIFRAAGQFEREQQREWKRLRRKLFLLRHCVYSYNIAITITIPISSSVSVSVSVCCEPAASRPASASLAAVRILGPVRSVEPLRAARQPPLAACTSSASPQRAAHQPVQRAVPLLQPQQQRQR